jgi:hypothetical protein
LSKGLASRGVSDKRIAVSTLSLYKKVSFLKMLFCKVFSELRALFSLLNSYFFAVSDIFTYG